MVCRARSGRLVSSAALCLFLVVGCESEPSTELGLSENGLTGGGAGAGSGVGCVPVDSKDTVPDKIDEDCDTKIDEDVDATRADCPRGSRVIVGTRGDDVLHGTGGRDCILGYGGNDTLYGEAGDDVIFGGAGDDRIFTGSGRDVVHGGAGADRIDTTNASASSVYGEAGADTLKGGSGSDMFYGGDDNDVLNGGGGIDVLSGGGCHDMLIGGPGADMGSGGKDFDACDTEYSTECERNGSTRKLCSNDAGCGAMERCAVNSGFCVPRSAAACGANSCTPTRSVDDTCDGVDDDCDGLIDDNYVPTTTSCGAGACSATGMTMCVNGVVSNSCHSGSPLPGNDATCDAQDDDCDGQVDEGFQPAAISCGLGVCQRSGATSCMGGHVVSTCEPGAPVSSMDDSCNEQDDDCDGDTDEDFVAAGTTCGLGACVRTGVTSCSGGASSDSCTPGTPNAAVDDSCNGVDDDCDGHVDEEFVGAATTCGFGTTCGRTGATSCVNGAIVDSCHVDCEGQCNDGAEDDNDGLVDCADPDCANAVGCKPGSFGSPCGNDSDCQVFGGSGQCFIGYPGGYCARNCAGGCPAGTVCLGGFACVVACGPGNHCGREGYTCSAVADVPNQPWCRPTCQFSCKFGTCNPDVNECQ